jgi:hypothetical protein
LRRWDGWSAAAQGQKGCEVTSTSCLGALKRRPYKGRNGTVLTGGDVGRLRLGGLGGGYQNRMARRDILVVKCEVVECEQKVVRQ